MFANVTNKHWPALHCHFFSKYTKFLFYVIYYLTKRMAGLGLLDVIGFFTFLVLSFQIYRNYYTQNRLQK